MDDVRVAQAEYDLKNRLYWKDLTQQFSPEELEMILFHWGRMISQFRDDVLPTGELQVLDAILWIVFGIIVVIYSTEQVHLARENFMIVQGTDNVLQWWFYVATPLAWVLLMIRVLQNLLEDIKLFLKGKPLPIQNAMTNISE